MKKAKQFSSAKLMTVYAIHNIWTVATIGRMVLNTKNALRAAVLENRFCLTLSGMS